MNDPKPGDRVVKNGIECTVHFVRNGEVFGVRYRGDDTDDSSLYRPLNQFEIPKGFLGTFRCSLKVWQDATAG